MTKPFRGGTFPDEEARHNRADRETMTQEFEFTDEMQELREMVHDFCREFSSEEQVRDTMETEHGYDPGLWRRLGSELGVLGLSVPESHGGAGLGLVHHAIVIEELGAALACGPVLGTLCLAIPALCALSDDAVKDDYLPGLVSGETVATVAVPVVNGAFDADSVAVAATRQGEAWTLTGTLDHVPDGSAADVIFVAARTGNGISLFAVPGDAPGVARTALSTMDMTRRQARIELHNASARIVADSSNALEACEQAVLAATVLLAVEQVGGSQRMLDVTVAYVRDRLQFGQPVGAFQAVKHRCANMLISGEQARSAAYHGAWALQDGSDAARLAASLAKAVASEAYGWISRSAIQLHGGMGFTWEGTPQLYFKRATTDALTLGTAQEHIDQVAEFAVPLNA